ncbi:MAG: FHA domain-containing protein [Planctomycetes bacterium]|nr:FHA domain-containing protein [Planctomycetota bacterium]
MTDDAPDEQKRKVLTLRHEATGRLVPIDVLTVVGRNDTYYRYTEGDERRDRLRGDIAEGLAALNYIKISSDSQISRSHGVIDPALPGAADLNSTNGTFLNDARLHTRPGEPGPQTELRHGDVLTIGQQRFVVELMDLTVAEHVARVHAGRRGCHASDWARLVRAERIAHFLEERKGFAMSAAVGWAAAIATCYHLQSSADSEGVVALVFCADARGEELVLDGQPMAFGKLVPLIARIPGRKVVVLDVDGDASACEQRFAAEGYEDMLLLTAGGEPALDGVVGTLGTGTLDGLRRSVAGEDRDLKGAHDDAVDGLDALIAADTNVLAVEWLGSYRGRLAVTFGGRPREDDSWLSHSLRFGSTTFRF